MASGPPSVGIDLGTTFTVGAIQGAVIQRPDRIADEPMSAFCIPSAVAYPPSQQTLVGWPARARRAVDPLNTLVSTKRLIGALKTDYRARMFAERHAYELDGKPTRACIQTRAGLVDPVDVAALVLAEVMGERGRDCPVVVTVPAAFEDDARLATVEAAERAGLNEVRLIEEPVATAISYLARSNLKHAVVYDFGGGTFDVAVIDCSRYPLRVAACGGDPYLGGDDVDRVLATRIVERVLREHRWDLQSERETYRRLVSACEGLKVLATNGAAAEMELQAIDPAGPAATLRVTRDEVAEVASRLVRRTFAICDAVMGEAKVKTEHIDAVFLAGGSSLLPGVIDLVAQYFGKRPRSDVDPMRVVAIGASIGAVRTDLWPLLSQLPEAPRLRVS